MTGVFHSAAENFQRWELPHVGPQPVVVEAANAPPQPTVHELEALHQQARDEGYAAGLAEGRAAAQQQLRQRMAELDALCMSAARPLQLFDDQAAEELAQLSMVVARRVIMHELRVSPGLITDIVRQAAAALPLATRELRVYLHPEDLVLLEELGSAERHWQLHGDATLARGDCRLESERSRLDARVETRLAALIDAALDDEPAPSGDHA
ncbi:flagellar assembly protein FliH [Rhodanobacter sp. TND4EL1]